MEQGAGRSPAAVRRSGASVDRSGSKPRRVHVRVPAATARDRACALVARVAAGDAAAEQDYASRCAASVATLLGLRAPRNASGIGTWVDAVPGGACR
jgi:hypothetical protein